MSVEISAVIFKRNILFYFIISNGSLRNVNFKERGEMKEEIYSSDDEFYIEDFQRDISDSDSSVIKVNIGKRKTAPLNVKMKTAVRMSIR